jgi:hypothetical protein
MKCSLPGRINLLLLRALQSNRYALVSLSPHNCPVVSFCPARHRSASNTKDLTSGHDKGRQGQWRTVRPTAGAIGHAAAALIGVLTVK